MNLTLANTSRFKFSTTPIICLLCGFGIYLGRQLRFNSWDILQDPYSLFIQILDIIKSPNLHIEAWGFTIAFGLFLLLIYHLVKNFKQFY